MGNKGCIPLMDQKIAERYYNYTFSEDPYIINIKEYVDLERTEIVHGKGG